jgi:hypothetical protein
VISFLASLAVAFSLCYLGQCGMLGFDAFYWSNRKTDGGTHRILCEDQVAQWLQGY